MEIRNVRGRCLQQQSFIYNCLNTDFTASSVDISDFCFVVKPGVDALNQGFCPRLSHWTYYLIIFINHTEALISNFNRKHISL